MSSPLLTSFLNPLDQARFFGLVLALPLALSSLNSKAMGLAWLLLVLAGAWAAVQHRSGDNASDNLTWLKTWCLVATVALLIKSALVVHWTDPWGERHGELRLFFGAWALFGLVRWWRLERSTLVLLAHAMTLTSALGLAWVIALGRTELAAHHIPWASAMAMVSAFLLALSLKSDFPLTQRYLWMAGGLMAVMAVLSSQSRGAYGIILWWLLVGAHHLVVSEPIRSLTTVTTQSSPAWQKWAWVGAVCLGLAGLSQSPVIERPIQSLHDAVTEIRQSRLSLTEGANSSVGARLYMWRQSLEAIGDSPWTGHGHEARKNFLVMWGQSAQSDEVKRLGHVHNEYLHQLLDHGIWGLTSQLLYLTALFWISWQLHQSRQTAASFALAGVAFMHMTTSLSNVNFSHNYYTATFSLMVGLSIWLTTLRKP